MEINGKKTAPQRARVLKEFRESPNPAVLIVSNVGIAGLNLDCANILIIAVSWFQVSEFKREQICLLCL